MQTIQENYNQSKADTFLDPISQFRRKQSDLQNQLGKAQEGKGAAGKATCNREGERAGGGRVEGGSSRERSS